MDSVCRFHVQTIREQPFFIEIINNIIGDMLMNKVQIVDDKLQVDIIPITLNLIYDWYFLAIMLNKSQKCDLIVYRGVKRMQCNVSIYQPIPFSTCIDYNNSLNWIIEDNEFSFIMEIEVQSDCLYTFTGNFEEGNEVILPAGYLIYKTTKMKEKIKVITFMFKESNFQEVADFFHSNNFFCSSSGKDK